jgi:sugar phosphate isomerase/epimerase
LFEQARTMQHNWLVIPTMPESIPRSAEGWKRFAARLNKAARLGERAGINVAYHNSDFEFKPVGKTTGFDILMAETDPTIVDFELDIFGAVSAGQDPTAMLDRWRGRFTCCHVKDMGPPPARSAMDVGAGTLNFAAILDKARTVGLKHWYIDYASAKAPIESVRASALAMTEL